MNAREQCPRDTTGQNSQAMGELKPDQIPAWRKEASALVKELLAIGSCWERESQVFLRKVAMEGHTSVKGRAAQIGLDGWRGEKKTQSWAGGGLDGEEG